MKNGGSFHSFLYVHQAGYHPFWGTSIYGTPPYHQEALEEVSPHPRLRELLGNFEKAEVVPRPSQWPRGAKSPWGKWVIYPHFYPFLPIFTNFYPFLPHEKWGTTMENEKTSGKFGSFLWGKAIEIWGLTPNRMVGISELMQNQ